MLDDKLKNTLLSCGCTVVIYNFSGLCFSLARVVYSEDAVFFDTPSANNWYGKLLTVMVEFLSTFQLTSGQTIIVVLYLVAKLPL